MAGVLIASLIVLVITGCALLFGNMFIDKFSEKENTMNGSTTAYHVGNTKYVKIVTADETDALNKNVASL